MKTIQTQVNDLLKKRYIITPKVWHVELDKLRSEFFGKDDQSLFPTKMHIIASERSLNQEVFWVNDGTSIAIDRNLYERRIINLLHLYDFKRELSGNVFRRDVDHKYIVYSQPDFVRGRQDLSYKIKIGQQ